MKDLESVFGKDLRIVKIREDKNHNDTDIVMSDRNMTVAISKTNFTRVMNELGIDVRQALRNIPSEYVDSRPLWKKDMDMRMGRRVDLSVPSHIPQAGTDWLKKRAIAFARSKSKKEDVER